MEQEERLNDWTFRYQYVYRLRRTNKQKQRFLSALVSDIAKMREDIKVIEYKQNKKYVSSNLYVGNIEKADKIVCTYYDTPSQSIGSYELFNRKAQSKGMTQFILLSSAIFLIIGLAITIAYMKFADNVFDFKSISTLMMVAFYGIYFYLFSKVTKGLPSRNNLVRNTSSVLTLLSMIESVKNKKIAFAFVDEGCFGELGLEVLQKNCKSSAKIYYLDSVGANTDLHFVGNGRNAKKLEQFTFEPSESHQLNYIFAARTKETSKGKQYYLEKSDLNNKVIKLENVEIITELFM